MSAGATNAADAANTTGAPAEPQAASRSRGLGVTAFILAAVFAVVPYLMTPVLMLLALNSADMLQVSLIGLVVHIAGMALAFVLGLIAIVTGRGRGWGIAAVIMSVVLNQLLWQAVFTLAFSGLVAPTY